jgi:uncharacterized RDD family membrane protein YckC
MNQTATFQPTMTAASPALRPQSPESAGHGGADARYRPVYLSLLTWAFALFNSLRAVSYLPTMWAIQASGDSSQHSLWTWCTWLGANVTMAAWLYEHNGQRLGRAVIVNIGNATMCTVTVALIVAHRNWPW